MKYKGNNKGKHARAYPVSDEDTANVRYVRAFPTSDDPGAFDKNIHSQSTHKIRIATWNLGSLTGRSQELASTLTRRNINICCIQETRWMGSKSRDLGLGYQLVYHGTNNKQNGVGIVLDHHFKSRIVNIERKSDRLMAIKIALDNQPIMNVICAYAPQSGCKDSEKDEFWEEIDEMLVKIPMGETKFVLGDLNGHVGNSNTGYGGAHGGFGYGSLNKDGALILEFAARHDLIIINTSFQKKFEHLVTYKSGGKQSQIDYILADSKLKRNFKDCKVIPGEALTAQHRILVGVYMLPKPIKIKIDRSARIKWKELTSSKGATLLADMCDFLAKDMENIYECVEPMWANFEKTCRDRAGKILGIAKGGLSIGKDPSWWNDNVKVSVQNKKEKFKIWQKSELDEDHAEYKEAKRTTKRMVARARAEAGDVLYNRLDNAKTYAEIFKLAKSRNQATQDIKTNKFIRSSDQKLLTNNEDINRRWFEYYKDLMNEEFPSQHSEALKPVEGPIQEIGVDEVRIAVSKMKNRKAVGPDEIPSELWKFLGPIGSEWLTKLFNLILKTATIPDSWRLSHLVPFYKNKGDITDCSNYRGIKLTSHSLKIWERIINRRIQSLSEITPNQFGFRMPVRIKGKIYKTAVRPALMYGSECWPLKEAHTQKLHTTEMKMLRWSGGVTRQDKIRNEYVRGSFKVAPIPDKLKESRLRCFELALREPTSAGVASPRQDDEARKTLVWGVSNSEVVAKPSRVECVLLTGSTTNAQHSHRSQRTQRNATQHSRALRAVERDIERNTASLRRIFV
ncbi:uncharacterized protein LOC126371623 [Pectinophora gossypiella]|uniref:uncharacterized protein LOC126371623 n=1 Tax=Pectinophora gossypiella TaxID=13191 RepID=UPI00214EC21F|nr:uncharacterized protein LOC126371623 [Pectinophora gossypiella]